MFSKQTFDADDELALVRTKVLESVSVSGDPHDGQHGAGNEPEEEVGVEVDDEAAEDDDGDDDEGGHAEGAATAQAVAHSAADQRAEQQT